MASTPSYVEAGRLRADTCGPGVLNRLFVPQRYMVIRYSGHLRPSDACHVVDTTSLAPRTPFGVPGDARVGEIPLWQSPWPAVPRVGAPWTRAGEMSGLG